MGKEYNNRRSPRSRNSAPHQLLVIVVTFISGYIAASFFDVEAISQWVNAQVLAHHEMKKEPIKPQAQTAIPPKPKFEFYTLLTNEKVPGSQANIGTAGAQPTSVANTNGTTNVSVTAPAPSAPATVSVSMPTTNVAGAVAPISGETLKPNTSLPVKVQQPNLATKAAIAKPASTEKGTFLVQVASFKGRTDAESMRGTLILKGFSAYIIPVSHATKGNWFRVVVGPYPNRAFAQQAQMTLAKNQRLNGMITSG